MKEKILYRIKHIKQYNNQIKIKCEKYEIEIKLLSIRNIEFLAVSGGGVVLDTYLIVDGLVDYDEIIKKINMNVFKGVDLDIEDSVFVE